MAAKGDAPSPSGWGGRGAVDMCWGSGRRSRELVGTVEMVSHWQRFWLLFFLI